MIIDFHTHTFPDPIADAAIDRLSRQANITAYTCGTAAGLLLAERAAGVDRSIILPVATKPEQVHHINDYAAAHNKHAFVTNMFSFGCIHPDYEDWKQELDRQISYLQQHLLDTVPVKIIYFVPDEKKDGGSYTAVEGCVRKIDENTKSLRIQGTEIPVERIYGIDFL